MRTNGQIFIFKLGLLWLCYKYPCIFHDLKNVYYVNSRRTVDSEKSEPQMGFKPTTLHDLVGCSNH